IITTSGISKLIDFGIAKATTAVSESSALHPFKGKVSYMSPEQAAGKPVDRRADIYCVGIMLWEALARRRLWCPSGRSEGTALCRIVKGEIPDVRDVRPVPEALAKICERALAREPDERYATAAEMALDLEAFIETSGESMSHAEV